MEVTDEMIRAVRAHEAARDLREEREWEQERRRRQRETEDRLTATALACAREILPDLTEEQFEKLRDVFSEYVQDLRDI